MDIQHLIHLDQELLLSLNGSDSLFWDGVMMSITKTATWIPLTLVLLYVLIKNNNMRMILLTVFMISLCIALSDQFSSSFCKPYFQRYRPTNDPLLMYQVDVVNHYRGGKYGFISSHAANCFSVFVYVSLLIRDRFLTLSLFFWAFLCSYSRIYLGVHYPGDILCGALSGVIIAFSLFGLTQVIRKRFDEPHSFISNQYTITGYLRSDVALLQLVLYLTFFWVAWRGTWMYF